MVVVVDQAATWFIHSFVLFSSNKIIPFTATAWTALIVNQFWRSVWRVPKILKTVASEIDSIAVYTMYERNWCDACSIAGWLAFHRISTWIRRALAHTHTLNSHINRHIDSLLYLFYTVKLLCKWTEATPCLRCDSFNACACRSAKAMQNQRPQQHQLEEKQKLNICDRSFGFSFGIRRKKVCVCVCVINAICNAI